MTGERSPLHTVVWACDGQRQERAECEYVRELCRSHRCRLWIVHVAQTIAPAHEGAQTRSAGEEPGITRLKGRTRWLRDEGIDASLHVVRGVTNSTAVTIAQLARDVDGDLLVVGARPRHPHHRLRPGATALQLLATAGCAVLWLGGQVAEPLPDGAGRGR